MASKRMFAQSVVGSWRFINMSRSARLLYYDIGMTADDEGVSEGLAVMRTTEASSKDFEELASNGFIDFLDKGGFVVHITDWTANNNLRADRAKPSRYHDLLPLEWRLVNDDCKKGVRQSADNCLTSVRQATDNCPPSIVEDSVDENIVSEDKGETPLSHDKKYDDEEYKRACKEYGIGLVEAYLQRVSDHERKSGKHYKNHLQTACLWIKQDIEKGILKPDTEKSYDINEFEMFMKNYKPRLSTQEDSSEGVT